MFDLFPAEVLCCEVTLQEGGRSPDARQMQVADSWPFQPPEPEANKPLFFTNDPICDT